MFYRFVANLCRIFFSIFFRVNYEGLENVPEEGPLIVCCKHISLLDMFLFAHRIPRKVYFMAKKELFRIPLVMLSLKLWELSGKQRSWGFECSKDHTVIE